MTSPKEDTPMVDATHCSSGVNSISKARIYVELLYHGHVELLIRLRDGDITCLEEVRAVYVDMLTPEVCTDEEKENIIELVDMDIITLKKDMDLIPTNLEHAAAILTRLKDSVVEDDVPHVEELIRMAKGQHESVFDAHMALSEIYINNQPYGFILCEVGNYVTECYNLYESCRLDEDSQQPNEQQDGMFKALQSASFA